MTHAAQDHAIPPGYKMTEVGVIPEDWDVKPLGDIGEVCMCKRVLKHQTHEHGDVPFYKIGTFGGEPDAFISQSLFDEFRRRYSFPKEGDILISAAGTIGRTVTYDGAPSYFQDSNIVWIDNDETKVTNAYLRHRYLVTKWSVSHGGTVARLYNDNLRNNIHIPFPTLPEQKAIATALSVVDELIESLEKLIAKKRAIKTGTMQQLLTPPGQPGHKRLPGFSGEWEEKRLGDVATFLSGGTPSRSNEDYWDGDIPWISASTLRCFNIYRSDSNVTKDAVAAGSKMAPIGSTLLLVRGSALHNEILSGLVTGSVCFNQDVKALVPHSCLRPIFLTFIMQGRSDDLMKLVSSAGNTAGVLDTKLLKAFELWIPPLPEQTAIASILSDMDAEIEALEARLEKTRAIKQGMMQELLTGRTRLI